MNAKFADDRLTAYLDDKLSAEEAAEIRLEASRDHELRCLLDDLRQARGELQALPRLRVSAGFADRVMAQIAQTEMVPPANPAAPVTPAAQAVPQPAGSWKSFVGGVTVASLVGFVVWFGFLRNDNGPVVDPVVAQGNGGVQPLVGSPSPEVVPPASEYKLTLTELQTELLEPKAAGQIYLLRVTVSNKLLLRGEFDNQLKDHGLVVRGSLSDRDTLRAATAAIEKLEPITSKTTRLPVDEVIILDGTAEQLAAALPVWTAQPADVAWAADEVLAISSPEKNLTIEPAAEQIAVRVGRKQLYREFGIDQAMGESSPKPEGSSEVLVVFRVK